MRNNLGLTKEAKKEMNKEAQTKKKEAEVPKLQDLLSRISKDVDVKETQKGTILRNEKTYLMHVKQSPRGILHFLRTKTGKHLEGNYATNKKELDALIQKINDKIKKGGETKSTSPPLKGKNEKAKA